MTDISPTVVVAEPVVAPVVGADPKSGSDWTASLDQETRGYLANRGWDKVTPAEAAVSASKAHREAEKFLGVSADKLLRLADPTNEAEYRAMWGRLGAPGDATKYDFSGVKIGEKPLDPALSSALAAAFDAAHVPLTAAQQVATAFAKFQGDQSQAQLAERQAALDTNKATLAKEWGANADANLFVAKSAAQKLGVDPDTVAALENQIGYPKVMEMFRKIGEQMGEARFVTNQLLPGSQVFTRDQAVSRLNELKADREWSKAYMDGDAAKGREMRGLLRIITGEDESTYSAM